MNIKSEMKKSEMNIKSGCMEPMLASTYVPIAESPSRKNTYYTQPKLDGVRMLAWVSTSSSSTRLNMSTRNGKPLKHLIPIFEPWLRDLPGNVVLDGELYTPGSTFQEIVSMVKNTKDTTEAELRLEFHVFDVLVLDDRNMPFVKRMDFLEALMGGEKKRGRIRGKGSRNGNDESKITLVSARAVHTHEEVLRELEVAEARGYEGLMVRTAEGLYECGKRSKGLMKLKTFVDEEFLITDVIEATGKDKGTAIFVCRTGGGGRGGKEFRVRPVGTLQERRMMFERREECCIGKMLTVRFQEKTDGGVPRFPVGITVRDYE